MSKTPFIAAAVLAAGLACGSAQARDVYWSVGINAPLQGVGQIGTVVGNYPGQAVVYQPAYQPVYQPVYQYRPAPVVYYPAPVVYPAYGHRHHPHWDRRDFRRENGRDEWRDQRHRHHGR